MAEFPPRDDAVDVREDVRVTEGPGIERREHVVQDVGLENRSAVARIAGIVWLLGTILEALIVMRIFLRLIAANPGSGFAQFINALTSPFLIPFAGLTATPGVGNNVLDVPALIALVVYAFLTWVVVKLVWLLLDRPVSRRVTTYDHR